MPIIARCGATVEQVKKSREIREQPSSPSTQEFVDRFLEAKKNSPLRIIGSGPELTVIGVSTLPEEPRYAKRK